MKKFLIFLLAGLMMFMPMAFFACDNVEGTLPPGGIEDPEEDYWAKVPADYKDAVEYVINTLYDLATYTLTPKIEAEDGGGVDIIYEYDKECQDYDTVAFLVEDLCQYDGFDMTVVQDGNLVIIKVIKNEESLN